MMVAGFDTATSATVAGVLRPDGQVFEARDDPPAGARPNHARRLLGLLEQALADAGAGWAEVERLAVGVGPGGFTGLRIGVATARGLAQGHGLPVVAVGSLHALAAGEREVAAVLDARRGEVFAAVWKAGRLVLGPVALAPEALAARLRPGTRAVGDGAVRFAEVLEGAGAVVPPPGAPEHALRAAGLCRLGMTGAPVALDTLLPDYRREPDASPPPQ